MIRAYCRLAVLLLLCIGGLSLPGCDGKAQVTPPMGSVTVDTYPMTGAEQLMATAYRPYFDSLITSKIRVGIVANQSSIVRRRQDVSLGEIATYSVHLVDTLRARGVNVVRIFSPEHGFRGQAEAGAAVADGVDATTGLRVVSLYGNHKKPTADEVKDLQLMIFDLQDVGCRFYTYISTLHYVIQVCAEHHIPLVILDRPNPNGDYVDGPVLDTNYRSFVGMHPVPIVYGMTIGEYGRMIVGEGWTHRDVPCHLTVISMQSYTHATHCALPIAPSPNLQNIHAIRLYPSLCLFEGTGVSVGRGTDSPFELIGAPGCTLRDFYFTPRSIPGVSNHPPYEGQVCYGLDLRKTDAKNGIDLHYLLLMYSKMDHAKFFTQRNFFDKLAGSDILRRQIQQGMDETAIRQSWQPALSAFRAVRAKYLIYP